MNYQNTQEAFLRPVIDIGVNQRLQAKGARDFLGGAMVKAIGKVALILLPLLLIVNFKLFSATGEMNRSITTVDNQHHELMDKNIELLARKAQLLAPDSIQQLAGKRLALYPAAGDQVERLN
jgi:hypothetical protein